MTSEQQATCPHCETRFYVTPEQLQQASGKVRCGNCLQVFDALSGEINFIPPTLPEPSGSHPLTELNIKPMAAAELPRDTPKTHWSALLALALLGTMLAAQLYLRLSPAADPAASLQLSQLVVRKHPEIADALRVEAILYNPGALPVTLPALELEFSNRYGESRAARTFVPDEYLHGEYSQALELPARSQLQVSLSLQDPGREAVNFKGRLKTVKQPTD